MRNSSHPQNSPLNKDAILTKALLRAAELLEISRSELSKIVGASEAKVSRLYRGTSVIQVASKEGEVAALLLRVFRSLDSLLGGVSKSSALWLRAPNSHLGGVPLDRLTEIQGLVDVVRYLDAMRAKI